MVAAALNGAYGVTNESGVGGEVAAFVLEVIRLKGDGTVIEVGIVLQQAATVDEHRVGFVRMALYEPHGHVCSHLDTVQDTLNT